MRKLSPHLPIRVIPYPTSDIGDLINSVVLVHSTRGAFSRIRRSAARSPHAMLAFQCRLQNSRFVENAIRRKASFAPCGDALHGLLHWARNHSFPRCLRAALRELANP